MHDVRGYRAADVGSDHNLVVGKIHLKLKKATKPEVNKTYAPEKLKEQTASEHFRIETRDRFAALEHATYLEKQWQMFVSGVTDSAAKISGKRRGVNKERWISCETWDLIDERKRTKNAPDQTKDSHGWKTRDIKYRETDKEVTIRDIGWSQRVRRHNKQQTKTTPKYVQDCSRVDQLEEYFQRSYQEQRRAYIDELRRKV